MASDDVELAGVAEIAQELGVARTTVSMWRSRHATTGFPKPLDVLSAGPVFDMRAVREWHRNREAARRK